MNLSVALYILFEMIRGGTFTSFKCEKSSFLQFH